MTEEEKKALNSLQNLIKNKAKETTVYKKAENVIKKHPVLATTVSSLVKQELGGSINVGENKSIGFAINPKDKKASIGFKMSFDNGGKIGFSEAGMVEELAEMTVEGAFDRMMKVGTEGSQSDYRSGKNMTQKILKGIFPDVDNVMSIKIKDLTLTDAENFIKKADELKIGKNVIEKFRYAFTVSGRSPKTGMNLISTIQDTPGRMDELYTKGTQTVGTPLQNFGDNDSVIKNVDNWLNTKMNPIFKGTVKGSNVRLAKIVQETGLRPVDIVRLRPTDVDFKNGFIRYMSAKGAAGKNIPITDEALNLLKQQWNAVGKNNLSKQGNRLFGRVDSANTIVSAATDAKQYESNWSKQFRKAFKKNELEIFDDAIKKSRAFRLYDFRSYHADKLISSGQGSYANDIMGWKSGKEEKIPSKMLQTVYGQTADRQLVVTMSPENIKLKNIVNEKQKIIYSNINKKVKTKIIKEPITTAKPINQQVEEIKTKTPAVTMSGTEMKISQEGTEEVEKPKRNWKKTLDTGKKVLSKAAIASILTKVGKAASVLAPIEPIQVINEVFGGKEGFLPTSESGKLFGVFEPTISKDVEATSEMLGVNNKKSQDEQVNELMPEEMEQFEQQGRI